MAMEVDDDVFFADLSKQIALLIMDEDEEAEFPVQSPPVHFQGFHHVPQLQAMTPPPYTYDLGYTRESISKGTGVFIPRSSVPRRKNRTNRSSPANNGAHRQLDKSVVAVSRVANNEKLNSNHYNNSGSLKNRT